LVGEGLHKADDGRRQLVRTAALQYQSTERTFASQQRHEERSMWASLKSGVA
jgi:hypothetical protein